MIKVFECFAGYGGASWGLKLANIKYECVGYSEIKQSAIKCYNFNFPNIKNYGNITKINWNEVPDFDLLTGGFPCQDVSSQGKQNLIGGRTILINELLKALEIKKPKYFLFENVSNIQADKFKDFLFEINNNIKKLGYKLYFKELQSCDYGTPNYRIRVWFIGYRNDIIKPFGFLPYPKEETEFLVLKDILEERTDDKYLIENTNKLKDVYTKRIKKLLYLGKYKDCTFESGNAVYSIYGISPTLLCGLPPNILLNNNIYKITEKEMFRIQGFLNDEININGISYNKCIDLAGDGWDVNLVSKIYKNMKME